MSLANITLLVLQEFDLITVHIFQRGKGNTYIKNMLMTTNDNENLWNLGFTETSIYKNKQTKQKNWAEFWSIPKWMYTGTINHLMRINELLHNDFFQRYKMYLNWVTDWNKFCCRWCKTRSTSISEVTIVFLKLIRRIRYICYYHSSFIVLISFTCRAEMLEDIPEISQPSLHI